MTETNPYKAPESEIQTKTGNNSDNILNFKRFSTWLVFLFSIITLGIYNLVWIYTRTAKMNEVASKPIPMGFPIAIIILSVISIIFPQAGLAGLASFVVSIIWSFAFRAELDEIHSEMGSSVNILKGFLSALLTIFVPTLYFQYKINQMHDEIS